MEWNTKWNMKLKSSFLNLKMFVFIIFLLSLFNENISWAGKHSDYDSSEDSYESNYASSTYYQYFKKPGDLSVGLMLGSQVGASATYVLNPRYSLEVAGAMELGGHQNIYSWGTFLGSYPEVFHLGSFSLGWFWGVGGKFRTENNPDVTEEYLIGPRGVVGLTHFLSSWAVELLGQVGYTQYVTQISKGEIDFLLGARYYF